MSGRIIFLLEEASMRALLDAWLPRVFPTWLPGKHFLCIIHQGKNDLEKSIPRKLKAWRNPNDRFVIVRDSDGADCRQIKAKLTAMCQQAGSRKVLVRLVCQELESWYLGDLTALATAFDANTIHTPKMRQRFAIPDDCFKPSRQLKQLIPAFQKISGARLVAQHLDVERNTSHSLQVFVSGVRHMGQDMRIL